VGRVDRICLRRGDGVHELIDTGDLSVEEGLTGDRWVKKETRARHSQLTVINTNVASAFAHDALESWESGDNFQVTLDIGEENLPAGTRLRIGEALIEVTAVPHHGCKKFRARFGADALKWVQMKANRPRRLRGLHAEVIEPGRVRVGDAITVVR
jgi:MOSC domain-containing protein YiiM